MKNHLTCGVVSAVTGILWLLPFCTEAQPIRDFDSFYVSLRFGANAYGGELDGTGTNANGVRSEYGWLFSDLGLGLGTEAGYRFSQQWSAGIGLHVGAYPNLDRSDADNPHTGIIGQLNSGRMVSQLYGLGRFSPVMVGPVSPYAQAGIALVVGQGREPSSNSRILGYGPTVGAGVELPIGGRSHAFIEVSGSLVFPDDAVDSSDPGGQSLPWADNAAYDATLQYTAGLRFFFRRDVRDVGNRVSVQAVCPDRLRVGQPGVFAATSNPEAEPTVFFTWTFGDGTSAAGMTNTHVFIVPGTYSVTLEASGPVNVDTHSCIVQVDEPASPPALVACYARPRLANVEQEIEVTAEILGPHTDSIEIDFGDSTTAESIPAQHAYTEPGMYEVTISARNSAGSDTCVTTVTVAENLCAQLAIQNPQFALYPVHFDTNSAQLSADARASLDANTAILRGCINVCVAINGYADRGEEDHHVLSTMRAEAVARHYSDDSRVRIRGRGVYSDAHPDRPRRAEVDPRVVESMPVECGRLDLLD